MPPVISPGRIRRTVLPAALVALALPASARGDGAFQVPGRGEALAPGTLAETSWTLDCSAALSEADEAELVLSLDGGRTFPIRVSEGLSVCASRWEWRVPSLPTRRARLALRTGSGGGERTEALRVVSDVFTILQDADGRTEPLYARGAEWWTRPARALATAEDLLSRHVSAGGRLLAFEPDGVDLEPTRAPAASAARSRGRSGTVSESAHHGPIGRFSPSPPRIPLALRL